MERFAGSARSRQEFGKEVYLSRCYEFLDVVGYSQQLPRPRHVEAEGVARRLQKKILPEAVKAVEASVAATDRRVEVWCMDEHRLGLKPILGKVWAERGKTPIAPVKHRYEWLYLYAFICPHTGQNQHWLSPNVDTPSFGAILNQFAIDNRAGVEREIILVLDQAGWHATPQLHCPQGIHLVFLPSHSPELQPAERLWQWTDLPLKNRYFESLHALQIVLERQCTWLEGQWEKVKGLTGFHWWPYIIH